MITITINETLVKNKIPTIKKSLRLYNSLDKARKEIEPITSEMRDAKRNKRNPKVEIIAVSYDTDVEKQLLLSIGAFISIDNETA